MLNITKYIIFILLIFVLSGCLKKSYTTSYYQSDRCKNSSQYKKIKNQKIKNSKAMHKATMKPYIIAGKKYYPTKTKMGAKYRGIASWYGPNFHAKLTSNGEVYDMFAFTAASKTLPMNTMVEVKNLENGKKTIVRINDRGPFIEGRIIDLSNSAARQIDMVKQGTVDVELTVIGFNGKIARNNYEKNESQSLEAYSIQIGAFSKLEGAKITKKKIERLLENTNYKAYIKQSKINGKWLNRVIIKGFRSLEEAEDYQKKIALEHAIIIGE